MNYFKKPFSLLTMAALAMVVFVGGCQDLSVQNTNEPDRERALASPEDVESLISASYRTFYYAGESYEPPFALSVAADELSSSWGNFGMQYFGSEPREPVNNDPSWSYSEVINTPFSNSYAAISSALEGIAIINEGTTIDDEANTQRALAFGQFVVGAAHGYVAVMHDQGFVVDELPSGTFNADNPPFEIVDYQTVFEEGALPYLSTAIQTAENAPDFTIPEGWMGSSSFTKEEFIGVIKTYRAHYRASLARTPQERQNVDWQAVLQDINDGYTEMSGTFMITDTPQENWFSGFRYYGKNSGWTRADNKTIGPADNAGNYQDWLDTPVADRLPFLIETDDRRITGDDPTTDGKYFNYSSTEQPFPADRGTYHYSYYVYHRNPETLTGYQTGNEKWLFTEATMRLLKAEALLHLDATANKSQVVGLINESRVDVGELDPATMTDDTGSMSDPQSALNDASLWSKLKHEKRMESFGTTTGLAFFDKRGWGDLVEGTPIDLPIPGEELLVLQEAIYTSDVVNNDDMGKAGSPE